MTLWRSLACVLRSRFLFRSLSICASMSLPSSVSSSSSSAASDVSSSRSRLRAAMLSCCRSISVRTSSSVDRRSRSSPSFVSSRLCSSRLSSTSRLFSSICASRSASSDRFSFIRCRRPVRCRSRPGRSPFSDSMVASSSSTSRFLASILRYLALISSISTGSVMRSRRRHHERWPVVLRSFREGNRTTRPQTDQ